jgi:hypothetical protein
MTSNTSVRDVAVTLDLVSPGEAGHLVPGSPFDEFTITPVWQSGFLEKRPPDSYIIRFRREVSEGHPLSLVLRLPLKMHLPVDNQAEPVMLPIKRRFNITTNPPCQVETKSYDVNSEGQAIAGKLLQLAVSSHSDKHSPLRIKDPDAEDPPLKVNEVEASIEFRCDNLECKHPVVNNLEGQWGNRWTPLTNAKRRSAP